MSEMLIKSWDPILSDGLIAPARSAIEAVATDCYKQTSADQSTSILCDFALLFSYMHLIDTSQDWRSRAIICLETAIEKASAEKTEWAALFGGMTGVGWTVEHVASMIGDEANPKDDLGDPEDSIGAIDDFLIDRLKTPWFGPYDLIAGLVGFGVYFLERLPRPSARFGIVQILDQLDRQQEVLGGATWHTPPCFVPDEQREFAPNGYYNLGVAHGVPGVLYLLAEIASAGIEPARSQILLDRAVHWFLLRDRGANAKTRFGSWFVPGQQTEDSRLGWCYGDLGIGGVLFQVGTANDEPRLRDLGMALLDRSIDWPIERAFINDAGLCHGAIGVAHIFNRTYQTTGETKFKDAASHWYECGLQFRRQGSGPGGFFSYRRADEPELNLDAAFLSGASGIALALISAVYPVVPNWDRRLLLSPHARQSSRT